MAVPPQPTGEPEEGIDRKINLAGIGLSSPEIGRFSAPPPWNASHRPQQKTAGGPPWSSPFLFPSTLYTYQTTRYYITIAAFQHSNPSADSIQTTRIEGSCSATLSADPDP